jgi:hypothetical protein
MASRPSQGSKAQRGGAALPFFDLQPFNHYGILSTKNVVLILAPPPALWQAVCSVAQRTEDIDAAIHSD